MKAYLISFLFFSILLFSFCKPVKLENEKFVTYTINPKKHKVQLFWKNEQNENFRNAGNLNKWFEKSNLKLLFACNAGMFEKDLSPVGLFIEKENTKREINKSEGKGNFFMKPNGIFFMTKDYKASICVTEEFKFDKKIDYATQSGPMLIINENINPEFKDKSKNINIRNGVGILQNGDIVFVMSKDVINFYDFANYFKALGCKNALYLDGFVSRTYCPEKKCIQTDGNFGVMFGILKNP